MAEQRRIRIIVNPSARSGRGKRAIDRAGLRELNGNGTRVEWLESRCAEHLREMVAAAQDDDLDVLGLGGGDGTVTIALSALTGPNRVPLAILPSGSGNDFANDVGVPNDLCAAFDVMKTGKPRWVDVAKARPFGDRYCCVASVGLDEHALRIIHSSPFRRSKALNLYASLHALVTYRPRPVRLEWESGAFEGEVMFAAVTNTRSYGGGFRVSPTASVDDGSLDLCVVRRTGRARLLGQFRRILDGTIGEMAEVVQARSPWVRLESMNGALPVTFDGELPTAATPVELVCEPRALQVLVPAGVGDE